MQKYYTYKVTFKDLPGYFYYGYHRHKNDMKLYFGTPKTWKHLWSQFEPEKQVLQWYETLEEVKTAEDSILKSTWKNPGSLNENCGGTVSPEVSRRTVLKMNSHPNTVRARSSNQKKNGGKNSIPVICLETGEIFPSAYAASRKTDVCRASICMCCKASRETAGGYHWQYSN